MAMHAWISTPDDPTAPVLEQREIPEPGRDEIRVRVRAAAVNNADLVAGGEAHVAGYEFSGEVDAVGPDGDAGLIGRRVMGTAPDAFADFVVVHRRHVLPVPDGMTHAEAAPLPTALLTEYGALRQAGLQRGDTVLLTAATSGIALIGVQIAHVLGADRVIGTTRSSARTGLLQRVGVDHVIVAGDEDLAEAVRRLTGGTGADVVLDHVGGAMLDTAIGAVRRGGSVVSVGRLAGSSAEIDLFRLAGRSATLRSVSFGFSPPEAIGDLLDGVAADVLAAVADGRVRAPIGATYPFDDAPAAIERLRDGVDGKVVLTRG